MVFIRVILFTPSAFYFNLHSLKKRLHLFSKQCFPADSPIEYKHVSEIWLCQKVRTHFALKKKKIWEVRVIFKCYFS